MKVEILFGSQTGNAKGLAYKAKMELEQFGFKAEVLDMENVFLKDLKRFKNILIITSTWFEGDPPLNAEGLYEELEINNTDLSNISYSVFAIGRKDYGHFCKTGIDFDKFLAKANANRIIKLRKNEKTFNKAFSLWIKTVKDKLRIMEN